MTLGKVQFSKSGWSHVNVVECHLERLSQCPGWVLPPADCVGPQDHLPEPPASTQARGPGRPGWRVQGIGPPNLRWGKWQCWKLLFCVCGEGRRDRVQQTKQTPLALKCGVVRLFAFFCWSAERDPGPRFGGFEALGQESALVTSSPDC